MLHRLTITARNFAPQVAWLALPLVMSASPLAYAADHLAKACGPNDKYVIGFSQANNAEPYRQHVNNDLTAVAAGIPQFELNIAASQQCRR